MAVAEWSVVQNRPQAGQLTADLTVAGIDRAVAELQTHYQQGRGEPFQARIPNPSAAVAAPELGEHQRAVSRTDRSDRFGPEAMRRIRSGTAVEEPEVRRTARARRRRPARRVDTGCGHRQDLTVQSMVIG
jgi:Asp-tRNA(Asn)/Glu-tRNA(Gln) amidotransferase A subunit family amidase